MLWLKMLLRCYRSLYTAGFIQTRLCYECKAREDDVLLFVYLVRPSVQSLSPHTVPDVRL